MVKHFTFIWAAMMGIMWSICFKIIDPSMTVFQCATIGILTGIFFLLGDKD